MKEVNPRDWTEDAHLENGNYYCRCLACNETFTGYKRRVYCKLCVNSLKVGSRVTVIEDNASGVIISENKISTTGESYHLKGYWRVRLDDNSEVLLFGTELIDIGVSNE